MEQLVVIMEQLVVIMEQLVVIMEQLVVIMEQLVVIIEQQRNLPIDRFQRRTPSTPLTHMYIYNSLPQHISIE